MKLVLPRIHTLLATLLLLIARAHAQVDLARDEASRDEVGSASSVDTTIIPSPDDIHWDNRFYADSLNVTAMAAAGDELYLGGLFFAVGKVPANSIAVWNKRTKEWRPLGDGLDNIPTSLAVHDGDLYVGGWFSGRVRRWSIGERKWYPLPPLPDSLTLVTAIAVDASDLYVATMGFHPPGADLRGRHLWRIPLSGGAWERLDAAIAVDEGAIDHLVVMGGYLYASGAFGSIDGVPGTAWIARMNIRSRIWSPLGGGTQIIPDSADHVHNQGIFAMVGQGDGLYVGGRFRGVGGNLAWWDAVAETWHPLSVDGVVTALAVTADSLYAGGTFAPLGAGATSVHHLASISRDAGHGIGNFHARATSVNYLAATDVDLYIIGNLWSVGGMPVDVAGRADRSTWSWESLVTDHGLGISGGPVAGITVGRDGVAVTGRYPGDVRYAGILRTEAVTAFDGAAWRRLEAPSPVCIAPIARKRSSGMLDVYVACAPEWSADARATSLAHAVPGEDEGTWAYVPVWGTITTMVEYGGELWCAGDLRLRKSDSAGVTVASWDGATWTVRLRDVTVTAMAASATDLYAGGTMPDPDGGPGSGLARWDGSRWRSVGGGVGGNFVTAPAHVTALALQGSDLYVAGDFMQAGSRGIARWDGVSWHGLGRGITGDGIINALATRGSVLYAAGEFDALTGVDTSLGIQRVAARNIARWDNAYSRWTALGSGVDNTVNALAVWGNDLYVGGYFHTAGGNPSSYIALWHDPLSPGSGVEDRDAVASVLTPHITPNPAREKTRIGFTLPRAAHARLSIVTSAGIEITTLVDERLAAGEHAVAWDVSDVPGGVYFYRLRCDDLAASGGVVVVH